MCISRHQRQTSSSPCLGRSSPEERRPWSIELSQTRLREAGKSRKYECSLQYLVMTNAADAAASSIPSFCFPTPTMHFDAMQCSAAQSRGGFQLNPIPVGRRSTISRGRSEHYSTISRERSNAMQCNAGQLRAKVLNYRQRGDATPHCTSLQSFNCTALTPVSRYCIAR